MGILEFLVGKEKAEQKGTTLSRLWSAFAAAPALAAATNYNKTKLTIKTRGWRSNLNKINVLYGWADKRMHEVSAEVFF